MSSERALRPRLTAEKKKDTVQPVKPANQSLENDIIPKMEMMLCQWMVEGGVGWDVQPVKDQAMVIFNKLLQDYESDDEPKSKPTFSASQEWFDDYKKRFNPNPQHIDGITEEQSAEKFVNTFKTFVECNGYSPQQVFTFCDIRLFWKRRPGKTLRSFMKTKERAAAREKVILLLCANAVGDFKCKPLMIYRKKYFGKPKDDSKFVFPVHYVHEIKTIMTAKIFQQWFTNVFCQEVREYCRHVNIPFRILLLLSAGSNYPENLDRLNQHVKVMFVPPDLTELLHPMYVGIVENFQKSYEEHVISKSFSNRVCWIAWDNYEIPDAMEIIAQAWNCILPDTINIAWRNLWSNCVAREFGGSRQLAWYNVEDDFQCLKQEQSLNSFTTDNIAEFISMLQQASDFIGRVDPDGGLRTLSVRDGFNGLIEPYQHILDVRKQREEQQTVLATYCPAPPTIVVKEQIVEMEDNEEG